MRLTDISLTGYRCFDTVDLALEPGVTVIHGANGAGKTTLLEAVLFGLYGSSALGDATLADVITRGADDAGVALGFVHEGRSYRIEREVTRRGDRAATRRCVLTPADGEVVEGARAVRDQIHELVRMDAEAFVNSAYVKQGEINKLLHATPAQRQSMLDELLQLGRLETYRDRADDARLAVHDLARERTQRVEELTTQRDRLEADDPYETLNSLETERASLVEALEDRKETRTELVDRRTEVQDRLEQLEADRETYEDLTERQGKLEKAIEEVLQRQRTLRETLATKREARATARSERRDLLETCDLDAIEDREAAREAVESTIEDVEADIDAHRSTVEELRSTQAEASERIDALTERRESLHEERATVATAIEEDATVLADRREERDAIDERLEDVGASIPDWPLDQEAIPSRRTDLEADLTAQREELRAARDRLAALQDHVEQAERLAEEDRCPTCGQPVDESPHVTALAEDREEIDELETSIETMETDGDDIEARMDRLDTAAELLTKRATQSDLIEERAAVREERRERHRELEETIEEVTDAREAARADAEAATDRLEEVQTAIADCNARLQTARERQEHLASLAEAHERVADLEAEIDRLEERRDHLDELEAERREQLEDVQGRLGDLETTLETDDHDALQEELAAIADRLATAEENIDEARQQRDSLTERIGSVRTDIEQLEEVEERLDALTETRQALEGLAEEASALGELYGSIRRDLRERNVRTLEGLLNETFDVLYRNDAYARIDLSIDYELTVHQKDGTTLAPKQLSGGERAIFNLSLRCAIYRLLSEGVDGAAPMPPLMLDEPTVFLDQGHVGRLLRLLETMRSMGVEQTLVVSHHEALLDAAEHRVSVEKAPATNRSTVTVLSDATPAVEPG